MELFANIQNRWATFDGPLTFACDSDTAKVACGDVEVELTPSEGICAISVSDCKKLMPDLGIYELVVSFNDSEIIYGIERVSIRYTSKNTIIQYGKINNDDFDREDLFTEEMFARAILAAEEVIEKGCGRSFCRRKIEAVLSGPVLNELPVVDAKEIDCEDASVSLVSYCQATGVLKPVRATVLYGSVLNAQIANAATKLAASFLRPRATPENARGTAQDGVFISYELATGEDGSWTGLPSVDAAIATYKDYRGMIV